METFGEIVKWLGAKKVLWIVIGLPFLLIFGWNSNGQTGFEGGWWIWVAGWCIWAVKKTQDLIIANKSAITGVFKWLLSTGLIILFASGFVTSIWTNTTVPTDLGVWQQAMISLGLPQNTPISQTREQVTELVKGKFPQSSKKDELATQAGDALLRNDLAKFKSLLAEATQVNVAESVERGKKVWVFDKPWSYETVLFWTLLSALIGAFVGISFKGIGRVTLTPLIALIAAIVIQVFYMPPHAPDLGWWVFFVGLMVRLGDWTLGMIGVMIAFARKVKPTGKLVAFGSLVGLTVLGSLAGLSLDSFLQLPTLQDAVLQGNGDITLSEAWVLYQIGMLAGAGLLGMISTATTLAKAAPALEDMMKGP